MRSLVSFLFFLAFSHVSSFSPHSWVSTKRVESLSRLHDAAIIFRKDSEQLVEDGGVSKSIISTGTGSSGWLYGAKRLSNTNVSDIAHKLFE